MNMTACEIIVELYSLRVVSILYIDMSDYTPMTSIHGVGVGGPAYMREPLGIFGSIESHLHD